MKVHVRGNMCVQILETFVALSRVTKHEKPIVFVNTLGLSGDLAVEHLSKLFDCNFEIRVQEEMRKTPYWETGCARQVFHNRERILRQWMRPKPFLMESRAANAPQRTADTKVALHIRSGDKSSITYERCLKLAEIAKAEGEVTLFSDNHKLEIPGTSRVRGSPVEDWASIFSSSIIYCGPSMFPLTSLLLDPTIPVRVAGESWCDNNIASNDYVFIREAQEFCPNLQVIDDV